MVEEKLRVCIEALEAIRDSDPGPAYYRAKRALEEVAEMDKQQEEVEKAAWNGFDARDPLGQD